MYLNRENYFKEIIDQSIKAKENNDLLKSLSDANIYVDLEEFAEWVEDPNKLPSYFIDASKGEERVIPAGSLLYEKYVEQFVMVSRMQEQSAAGDPTDIEGQLETAIQDLLTQKQNEIDQAEVNFRKDIKEETGTELDDLKEQELNGVEVTKPISQDTINRKVAEFEQIIESLNVDDPVEIIDKVKAILNSGQFTEEEFSQELIDNEIYKLENDPIRLGSEVAPIYSKFEESYDISNREVAAYQAAATTILINNIIENTKTNTESVVQNEPVELVNKTQSFKDYQANLTEINERYEKLIQDLTDNFAKRGASTSKPTNLDVPGNSSWSEIEKLAPELYKTLTDKFLDDVEISPEDDKYELVRSNWLEQNGDIIKEYNAKKLAERILKEQEALQLKVPEFKVIKLPKDLKINMGTKITPLVIIRDAYQRMLDSGQKEVVKNKKVTYVDLTDVEKAGIKSDLEELDVIIDILRKQGIAVESSTFDDAINLFNELITARQDEIEKILDENGVLIERRIDGKVADRVTKKAEELDIELTPGKKPFAYNKLLPSTRRSVNDEGVQEIVEIPSPIMSAFDAIMEDDSIKPEDKLNTFLTAFETYVKSTGTGVFKDKNNKGLNAEKFRLIRERLEGSSTNIDESSFEEQKADIEARRKGSLGETDDPNVAAYVETIGNDIGEGYYLNANGEEITTLEEQPNKKWTTLEIIDWINAKYDAELAELKRATTKLIDTLQLEKEKKLSELGQKQLTKGFTNLS
ncbi:MAG: hypothetical protein WD512_16150, partial [Candidatus Paceibacterota bacterium]